MRKQYESLTAETLSEEDVLPEQPVLTPHPTVTNKKLSLKKRNYIADVMFATLMLFLIVVLMTAVLQRYFVGSSIIVNGSSMEPTFMPGKEVWVDKTRTPKRGDVVVLYRYDVSNKFFAEFAVGASTKRGGKYEKLIKRIVALEGDKLWVEEKDGNYVLVIETAEGELREDYYTVGDNRAVFYDERGQFDPDNPVYVPYVAGDYSNRLGCLTGTTKENPFVVREGRFFYMGDNRLVSSDSRDASIKDVPMERIIGVIG